MTTQPEARRPYAAPANVLAVLNRARSRNLPDTIGNDFLRLTGMPEVVFGRVAEALRFLGLVAEDGAPTQMMRSIASSSDADFKTTLEGAIRWAYAEDLTVIDPAQDDATQLIGHFRRYEPRSQTQRMVTLLLGLCREAGMPVKDAPRERKMRSGGSRSTPRAPRGGAAARGGRTTETRATAAEPVAQTMAQTVTSGLLFGVTEADIAALPDDDFKRVWDALGMVARARSRQRPAEQSAATNEDEEDLEDDE